MSTEKLFIGFNNHYYTVCDTYNTWFELNNRTGSALQTTVAILYTPLYYTYTSNILRPDIRFYVLVQSERYDFINGSVRSEL